MHIAAALANCRVALVITGWTILTWTAQTGIKSTYVSTVRSRSLNYEVKCQPDPGFALSALAVPGMSVAIMFSVASGT